MLEAHKVGGVAGLGQYRMAKWSFQLFLDYFTLLFCLTGSSPFTFKWRGSFWGREGHKMVESTA
jgi:hypothetical protein